MIGAFPMMFAKVACIYIMSNQWIVIYWRWGHVAHMAINTNPVVGSLVKLLHCWTKQRKNVSKRTTTIDKMPLPMQIYGYNWIEGGTNYWNTILYICVYWIEWLKSFVNWKIEQQLDNFGSFRFHTVSFTLLMYSTFSSMNVQRERMWYDVFLHGNVCDI